MDARQVYDYYSGDFVAENLLAFSRGREVAGALRGGSYDQRPNVLEYKSDILAMARKGVTSFHISVERWRNAMQLSARSDYNSLRQGWDLIIDMDSKLGIEAAKTAALHVCNLLESYGIKKYGIKFSGSRGFHVCVMWESFPKEIAYKSLAGMYPKVPRILARFIRSRIAEKLMESLMRQDEAKKMIEAMAETPDRMNPFYFVELEKDWGERHMFRAPLSLNEKTWLASVPLTKPELASFAVEKARPDLVAGSRYPEFFSYEENQAEQLVMEAMDWYAAARKEAPKKKRAELRFEKRVPEKNFPPCIRNILVGLEDGKKRSLFTLVNFLRLMNWQYDEIEERMLKWNESNRPPLPRNSVAAAVRYHHQNPHTTANCFNDQFYVSFGVCQPDAICKKMNAKKESNPAAYPFRTMGKSQKRGFSCMCGQEFASERALLIHKGRSHGE